MKPSKKKRVYLSMKLLWILNSEFVTKKPRGNATDSTTFLHFIESSMKPHPPHQINSKDICVKVKAFQNSNTS